METEKRILDELGLEAGAGIESWESRLKEKLGISILQMQESICLWLKNHAEEVCLNIPNIAPFGDYGALIEDNDGMAEFLKKEGAVPSNWDLVSAHEEEGLVKFVFFSSAVDDGKSLRGLVYLSKSGKIRHAFVS